MVCPPVVPYCSISLKPLSVNGFDEVCSNDKYLTSAIFVTTINNMQIEYDPKKNQRNIKNRDLSFDLVKQFEWESAVVWEDDRVDYGEIRYCTLGYIGVRLYHVAFTIAFTYRVEKVRVISLRKANKREVENYAET